MDQIKKLNESCIRFPSCELGLHHHIKMRFQVSLACQCDFIATFIVKAFVLAVCGVTHFVIVKNWAVCYFTL